MFIWEWSCPTYCGKSCFPMTMVLAHTLCIYSWPSWPICCLISRTLHTFQLLRFFCVRKLIIINSMISCLSYSFQISLWWPQLLYLIFCCITFHCFQVMHAHNGTPMELAREILLNMKIRGIKAKLVHTVNATTGIWWSWQPSNSTF